MDNREKIKSIFRFLLDVKKLDEKIIRSVDEYKKEGSVYWELDFPQNNPLCRIDKKSISDNLITIIKPKRNPAPAPSDNLRQYLLTDFNDSTIEQKHKDVICSKENGDDIRFDDNKELVNEWRKWAKEWESWSIDDTRKKEMQDIYTRLFSLYQVLEINKENFEIIYGNALLTWDVQGERIMHPLLTTRINLTFNAKDGIFIFETVNDGVKLELDALDNLDIPNRDKLIALKKEIEDSTETDAEYVSLDDMDIRNIDTVQVLLKAMLNYITDDGGDVIVELTPSSEIEIYGKPLIYNCPCIVVRKINPKMQIEDLNDIINSINNGGEIPKTITTLVSDSVEKHSTEEITNWKSVGESLLFPLQANEDQKEIARRLAINYGLVVQGPPGTGKSHTIANLICHLLANGKKVLVTSQTDKALKVLEEKIPNEISALCISLVGNDKNSMQKLSNSVRKIIENLSSNPMVLKKEIELYEKELEDCRKEIAALSNKLREIELKLVKPIKYNGLEYSCIDIAKWVTENENNLSWLEDEIDIDAKNPLSLDEVNRLLYLTGKITKDDIEKTNDILRVIHKIPKIDEIETKLLRYKTLKESVSTAKTKIYGWQIENNSKFDYSKALENVENCIERINVIEKSWLRNFNRIYHESEFTRDMTIQLRNKVNEELDKVAKLTKDLYFVQINGLEINSIQDFEESFMPIYNELNNKGKIGFTFNLFNSKSSYILNKLTINGDKITTKEHAKYVKAYMDKNKTEKLLIELWNTRFTELGASRIEKLDLGTIQNIRSTISTIDNIIQFKENCIEPVIRSLGKIKLPTYFDLSKKDSCNSIKEGILAINKVNEIAEIENYFSFLKANIAVHQSLEKIIEAIDRIDITLIRGQYQEIERLKVVSAQINEWERYKTKIKDCAPKFMDTLQSMRGNQVDFDKFVNWNEAWQWAQWNTLLRKLDKDNIDGLEKNLEQKKNREKELIQQLVAKQSWYNQIKRTTERQKRSLSSWQMAISKVGKGTGKHANYYRKLAQKEMQICKDAIPVWIMPSSKIIENLKLSNDSFDVVIFDESSQSDIFALPTLFRAKKAVIVGDDKQISPQTVGRDKQKILDLINLDLKSQDIPNAEWFDLETSLYNTALRVFPDRLMLKEHFRCVPEIIQFSNDLSYGGDIIPLRYPKKGESFDQPVETVKVDGYRDEMKKINKVEAEAIADKVVECCKADKYANMTMGVISLLGGEQAKLIDLLLRERLGEQEMAQRKIICGDSYSFQGDERDIIFMSLVIAPNVRFAALTKEDDIKRFNVAASRARNQMWLFHSVELSDLNPSCVRYSLLSYCMDPGRAIREVSEQEKVIESDFEKDVYKVLAANNYAVTPQVWAGRYRIDLVVEGIKNRLAIECDGDKWHGIEKWEEDRARQEQLERVGWKFVRIRGSEFYRDRSKAMEKVWKKLDEMGIEKGIKV